MKKVILIVVAAILLLCGCGVVCGLGLTYGVKWIFKEAGAVREDVIYDMCEQDFSADQYEEFFTKRFQRNNSFSQTEDLIAEAFPSSFDCQVLQTESFFEFLKTGQSISIKTENGKTTGQFSVTTDEDTRVTFHIVKIGGEWKVDEVAITTFAD